MEQVWNWILGHFDWVTVGLSPIVVFGMIKASKGSKSNWSKRFGNRKNHNNLHRFIVAHRRREQRLSREINGGTMF